MSDPSEESGGSDNGSPSGVSILRVSFRHILCCLAALAAVLSIIGATGPAHAQNALDPGLTADQRALIQAQIETEKARLDLYKKQARTPAAPREEPDEPFLAKFVNDPADTVAALGAIAGMLLAFFVLMGNRSENRRHRRDEQFYEALRRFGDGSPSMRAASAGIMAQMAKVRDRKSLVYLDTATSQLIAGYRLEEHEAVRQAITDALRELVETEPRRVRLKLSDAKIRLPEE